MLTGLLLVAASGMLLTGLPVVQELALLATAGLIGAKFFVVFLGRRGDALAEIHRRRIDALWIVVVATVALNVYMLRLVL